MMEKYFCQIFDEIENLLDRQVYNNKFTTELDWAETVSAD